MAAPRIALIHALPDSVEPANTAFAELWPEAFRFNLLDDALARDLAAAGAIDMQINSRIIDLSRYALAAGANGPDIHLYGVLTGQEFGTLRGHQGGITGLAFDATGKRLVSGSM